MRVQEQLDRVLYDGKGNPVPVTKIETDVIGHQFRWTLWAGARRLITFWAASRTWTRCSAATRFSCRPS